MEKPSTSFIQRKDLCKARIVLLLCEIFEEVPIKFLKSLTYKPLKKEEFTDWEYNYDPSCRRAYQEGRFREETFYESLRELEQEGIGERVSRESIKCFRLKKDKRDKSIKKYFTVLDRESKLYPQCRISPKELKLEKKLGVCEKNLCKREYCKKEFISSVIQYYEFFKRSNREEAKEATVFFKDILEFKPIFNAIENNLELIGTIARKEKNQSSLGLDRSISHDPMKDSVKKLNFLLKYLKEVSSKRPFNKVFINIYFILQALEAKGRYPNNPTTPSFCEKVLKIFEDTSARHQLF